MAKVLSVNDINRLREIKEEIKNLANEAFDMVESTSEGDRAKGYWFASIITALDDDHSYLGGGGVTLESTTEALDAEIGDKAKEEA